jgi:hypothetical protein
MRRVARTREGAELICYTRRDVEANEYENEEFIFAPQVWVS